ncbi:MAG: hypothetical protein A2W23_01440 [Planctomycetes bacterium RBG_16_43_13]|nr:MAG: hypothetical protein A2W23_01440 [Planctomycetes bacterium RBG_16_43_13]
MKNHSIKFKTENAFTLIEVLLAVAILALVTVVLLSKKVEIMRDAGRARDYKVASLLASQKMAEIEMKKEIFGGQETFTEYGDFEGYPGFGWSYDVAKQYITIGAPPADGSQQKQYEIYLVNLYIKYPEARNESEYMKVVSYFPKVGGTDGQK